jgi:hypothetical protein
MGLSHLQSLLARRRGLRVAFGFGCWLAWCSVTHAESPRILLVRAPNVSNELAQSAAEDLGSVGEIVDPRGYLTAAGKQHIEPTSEAALTRLGPQVGARLLVTLDTAHGKLEVTYRDGKTGAVVTEQKLPLHGKNSKVPPHEAHKLSATARHILAKLGKQHSSDVPLSAAVVAPVAAAPVPVAAPAPTPPPPAAQEDTAVATADEAQPAEDPPAETQAADSSPSEGWKGYATAGGGMGARSVRVPTRAGGEEVDTGFTFPAIEIGIGAQGIVSGQWLLSAQVQYRIMFGITVNQALTTGQVVQTTITSHSVVGGVAPGYRFGEPGSGDVRLLLAWTFRGLYPGDPSVPGGSVQGPMLRPELRFPFANGLFTLRIAPELIVVITSNPQLALVIPGVHQVGFGFGGEASLDLRLTAAVQLGLEYRESHVSIASDWGNNYLDMERYAILRVGVVF